jgi:hypothetical protein
MEALGMENNLKLNLLKLRKICFHKAWDAPTDRETSLPIDGRKIEILSWICNFLHLHLLFHIIQHNNFWRSGARRSHRSIQRPFSTLGGRLPASPRSRHTSSIATQLFQGRSGTKSKQATEIFKRKGKNWRGAPGCEIS